MTNSAFALRGNVIMNLSETCQEAHWKILLMYYPVCTEVHMSHLCEGGVDRGWNVDMLGKESGWGM